MRDWSNSRTADSFGRKLQPEMSSSSVGWRQPTVSRRSWPRFCSQSNTRNGTAAVFQVAVILSSMQLTPPAQRKRLHRNNSAAVHAALADRGRALSFEWNAVPRESRDHGVLLF